MRMLVALTIALSVFDGTFAQAPNDVDPMCTELLPGVGVNILDYAPQVKPLMDSRHYQNLLPPHADAVWQEVDDDNNNPSGTTTDVSCLDGIHKFCKAQGHSIFGRVEPTLNSCKAPPQVVFLSLCYGSSWVGWIEPL